ncbi:phenylacetaldehyde reductase-like [Hevea brasiliensis]|uniref:phenylacetaldehyde reductase-like n=1 Tax=Hevea brasiliensis TaxID=3981 RepID=UPI0025FC80D5|nr:phenylacetaldehyde reductase-like [Hevea brasiliensis]
MCGEGKVVCVTGGSGYIASWLIKRLLQRGYIVKATVRDTGDPKKTDHLLALDGAKERLHLFKANLLEEGSFDAAVDGCEGVFHTASPVLFAVTDPQAELIDPAVKGTLNVLKSCTKVQSIKRVIITSSMVTIPYNGKPLSLDVVADETWFSDPTLCKEMKLWYVLSKTLAEEAAWKFAKENSIDLVTLSPGIVIGPLLQPTLNETVEMILKLVNGAQTYPDAHYRSVDVRDVADANIRAFEIPSANGRYCLVTNALHFSEVLKIVHQHYPTLNLPKKCVTNDLNNLSMSTYMVSMEKAKTLGISFIPLEVTLRDTIESLKEKGFLSI